jgi:outer membrane biosynthesis protein TonB
MRTRARALRYSLVGLLLAGAAPADPDPAEANRYPYDPVCAWGRIASGKGMLVRCITQAEQSALMAGVAPAATPAAAPSTPPAPPPEPAEEPKPVEQELAARLVRINADEGKFPVGEKKLDVPRDRYVDCVKKHGGLTGERGEVQVRFLVRARGRAEGVSVAKHSGMSAKAAACIADVVDRREVGTPAAPMVGATAVIEVRRGK